MIENNSEVLLWLEHYLGKDIIRNGQNAQFWLLKYELFEKHKKFEKIILMLLKFTT